MTPTPGNLIFSTVRPERTFSIAFGFKWDEDAFSIVMIIWRVERSSSSSSPSVSDDCTSSGRLSVSSSSSPGPGLSVSSSSPAPSISAESLAQDFHRLFDACERVVRGCRRFRVQPGVHQRLTDLPKTYPEALAQTPAAAGPASRAAPLPGPQQTRPLRAHMTGCDGRGALREACTMVMGVVPSSMH
jgi:hypothetical protein